MSVSISQSESNMEPLAKHLYSFPTFRACGAYLTFPEKKLPSEPGEILPSNYWEKVPSEPQKKVPSDIEKILPSELQKKVLDI